MGKMGLILGELSFRGLRTSQEQMFGREVSVPGGKVWAKERDFWNYQHVDGSGK